MKRIARVFPLFVLLAGCATTQLPEKSPDELPSSEPFQGANLVLIQTDDDPEEIREKVVQAIRLSGYEVTERTLHDQTIATEPRTFSSGTPGSTRFYFELPEEEGQPVRLYGEYVLQQASDSHSFMQFPASRVMPAGDRQSTAWLSWLEMDELASAYRGGDILYGRE